jgi:hypothetical protein
MIERFQYHAFAVGAAGRIDAPFEEIIPIQASCALPETGGFGTARVDRFQLRDIFSFHAATSVVCGSYSQRDRSFDALATVTIEGMNLLGMVTADRIVARISSRHWDDGREHSITPLGAYFENLRIAGYLVKLHLATDTFSKFDTFDKVKTAYRENLDDFRDEFNGLSLIGRADDVPEKIRKYLPWCGLTGGKEIPETNGIIACSLVRELEGLGSELTQCGHVIHVPGFGTVRLAELKITTSASRLTMLQVELGSTPTGNVTAGGVESNGSSW